MTRDAADCDDPGPHSGTDADVRRQRELYWKRLFELKVSSVYMRLYRDMLGRRMRWIGIVRAVASSGGIAGWAVWQQAAFVWGTIIAAAQLADALKDILPFAALHRATSEHAFVLDAFLIDALHEWESVFAAAMSDAEIAKRRYSLMRLVHEAEKKNFPQGLPPRPDLLSLAQSEATDYLFQFGVEVSHDRRQ